MRKIAFSLVILLLAVTAEAVDLDVVTVAAPAINCKFDKDCKITVSDMAATFSMPSFKGQGFLQSRTWPVGEVGAPGAKLYAYLYRIDVTQWQTQEEEWTASTVPCVKELRLSFGPVAQVDYDGNGDKDQVFVITQGGIGTVKPISVVQTGNQITFKFLPRVCGHLTPGKGQTTFFIGLASTQPPQPITAQILHDVGLSAVNLKARAPKIP
jgi:hypothetical protein